MIRVNLFAGIIQIPGETRSRDIKKSESEL
jgi:hypothetical protein